MSKANSKKDIQKIEKSGKGLKQAGIILLIVMGIFTLFALLEMKVFIIMLLLDILPICLIVKGNNQLNNSQKYEVVNGTITKRKDKSNEKDNISKEVIKSENAIIQKINTVINNMLKENLPNLKLSELEENGKIYYMNGNNGTIDDWVLNEKVSDFMCFYKDGSCGVIKMRVHKDGSSNVYLYNYGENKPFVERTLDKMFSKKEVYELAIILNNVMDNNGIFDRAINDYNFNANVSEKEREAFEENIKSYDEE